MLAIVSRTAYVRVVAKLDVRNLGDYIREQRSTANVSLRQLAKLAGVSNPYLSQIERGLKKPSAEILKELARGLEVSAETLYVRAGILDEKPVAAYEGPSVLEAIAKDPVLTDRQRAVLVDVYTSFTSAAAPTGTSPRTTTSKEK
jgi:transcriptional regulator with XRE-family HTH domain